ncbi:MAG: hypothetical protein Q8Q18_01910 [bacterium]|nr:hypothetical protein [bacterium]
MLDSVLGTVLLWVINTLVALAPFMVAALLMVFAWKLWRYYLLYIFVLQQEYVLLELKLPREIFKSPRAMELILASMWHVVEGPPLKRLRLNNKRPWFALEIVSDGGVIHFYIRTPELFRNLVESYVYANYPDVEVGEVPDYTLKVPYGQEGSDWDLDALEFKLAKEDAIPLKTYVDYGLADDPKEEFKLDPLVSLLEHMSTCAADEKLWFQIIITASKSDKWKEEGVELVNKLLERGNKDAGQDFSRIFPSKVEGETVEAIQRSIDKLGFMAGVRAMYLFKEGKEDKRKSIGLYGSTKAFGSTHLNTLIKAKDLGYPYVWMDPFGLKATKDKQEIFRGYVSRSYFYPPVKRNDVFILTTEEIATLFHLPGSVANVPTLPRIESKSGDAPSNLPI